MSELMNEEVNEFRRGPPLRRSERLLLASRSSFALNLTARVWMNERLVRSRTSVLPGTAGSSTHPTCFFLRNIVLLLSSFSADILAGARTRTLTHTCTHARARYRTHTSVASPARAPSAAAGPSWLLYSHARTRTHAHSCRLLFSSCHSDVRQVTSEHVQPDGIPSDRSGRLIGIQPRPVQ